MSGNFELRHWRPRSQAKTIAIPATLGLQPITTPPLAANGDFKVDHWKEDDDGGGGGYTSLRDLLSSPTANGAINSPTPGGAGEIQIKNRLVKQAAYAYLQPTPSSTETSRRRRFSFRRAVVVLGSCFCFIRRFLRTIRIRNRS